MKTCSYNDTLAHTHTMPPKSKMSGLVKALINSPFIMQASLEQRPPTNRMCVCGKQDKNKVMTIDVVLTL